MLTEVKNHLRLFNNCFKYNLLKAMDNRVSFIAQILGMALNNAIMIIQWIVLFSLKDNIGGYGFNEVLLLWAFASMSYGFAHALFNNSFNISSLIVGGKLDAFLVQPKDSYFYMSCSSSSISALGDILYGLIILIFLKASVLTWILTIFLAFCGGLISTAFSTIWHSFTFWFGNMDDFASIMNSNLVNMATYPDGIFSKEIRWLFLTLLPISFIVHIPVKIVTKFNIGLLLITISFTLLIVIFSYVLFNKGLKKYSSSNLMSARI